MSAYLSPSPSGKAPSRHDLRWGRLLLALLLVACGADTAPKAQGWRVEALIPPMPKGSELGLVTAQQGATGPVVAWLRRDGHKRILGVFRYGATAQQFVEARVPGANDGKPNILLAGQGASIVLNDAGYRFSLSDGAWHGDHDGPPNAIPRLLRLVPESDGWLGVSYQDADQPGEMRIGAFRQPGDGEPAGKQSIVTRYRRSDRPWGMPLAYSRDRGATPAILVDGRNIHLLVAVSGGYADVPANQHVPDMQSWAQHGRIDYWYSPDAGRHWRQRPSLPVSSEAPVQSLAWLSLGENLYAVQGSAGLYATPWRGSGWDKTISLAPATTALWGLNNEVEAVCATNQGKERLLAWIDSSHRKSDRRWWKPLGGWPWSDSPEWQNNDIRALSGTQLVAALAGSKVTGQQVTGDGGQATSLACVNGGTEAQLFWTGSATYRKGGESAGMQVFRATREVAR